MAIRVERTPLPGIGVRHDILTAAGRRIGVVSHRTGGQRELVIGAVEDPDASTEQLTLSDDEAEALAELLGSAAVLGRLTRLTDEVNGIFTEQISLGVDSPYAGRRLGETRARTRTKASIVAVVRGTGVHPSPGPDFAFEDGDLVVAVGTRTGLDRLTAILSGVPG
jgi:K+:H+ antiporter subunit KhtT